MRSTSTSTAIRSTIACTTRAGSSEDDKLTGRLAGEAQSADEVLRRLPRLVAEHHDADQPSETIHDGSLGIGERPGLGTPEADDAHPDAPVREGCPSGHRDEPADPDVRAEHLRNCALLGRVGGLDRSVMQHRSTVEHPVVQRPPLADKPLRPGAGGRDHLEDVGSRGRHDRDHALRVRDHRGALDGHRSQKVSQRHALARVGGSVVQEAPDEATDRLVDAARLLVARRSPLLGAGNPGGRLRLSRFGHGYMMRKQDILVIATISPMPGTAPRSMTRRLPHATLRLSCLYYSVVGCGNLFL